MKRPLFLLAGKQVSAQGIAKLCEVLAGRKATEDEMAEVEKILSRRKPS